MSNTNLRPSHEDPTTAGHDWRLGRFPNLMPHRIQEVLLVSSPYDSFILEEDGLLTEMIYTEYLDLGLTHAPNVTRVSTGEEALAAIRESNYDLVITMLRLGDMDVAKFAAAVQHVKPGLPVVLLILSEWDLARASHDRRELSVSDVYVWHGDTKLFLAIIKAIEDRLNAEHDTQVGDVGVIILVEDSIRFRSSLLPLVYSQLVQQTRAVMADGLNHMDKLLRMRARPKVLLAETYEEGLELYQQFRKQIFGVIADVAFPRGGKQDPAAGIQFIKQIKEDFSDTPALLQSSDLDNAKRAAEIGARFLHKRSATLLDDLRHFILEQFGFGDFVFRTQDGHEVGRAADLRTMAQVLRDVPIESVEFHARRNHFSNWLRARTEFALARRLRPRRVSEFGDLESLRRFLIRGLNEAMSRNRRGLIEDFSRQRFDTTCGFARIGGGSLGGKARGLAFVEALLAGSSLEEEFPDVRVQTPPSVVIGTDVFDSFLDTNNIRTPVLRAEDDRWIAQTMLSARLPDEVFEDLRAWVEIMRGPIAVRSSSLLEDSAYHPFAGVYATYMLPNNHPDPATRLLQLRDAIKLVYASTFFAAARRYLAATPHRIEEEKMAVILQPIVGAAREDFFYPSFSGVARSYNYYPMGVMKPEDGVASVALGLGKTIVDGGQALRFCPAHPWALPQLGDAEEFMTHSQRTFYAVDLRVPQRFPTVDRDDGLVQLDLDIAEQQRSLHLLGSTWSSDNQTFYDGIERPGTRVVTFAHILKNDAFPLAALVSRLLAIGRAGMNSPVEIEFAGNLESDPKELAILQIRPCGACVDETPVELEDFTRDDLLCYSTHALGNGVKTGLSDIVYVRPAQFDAAHTPQMAEEIGQLNERLMAENRPYVLIGPGRWGSSHPWLGIPVVWSQISAARVLVETTLRNFVVEPSQGSHFFQNLTSFGIVYFAVNPNAADGYIDWNWLEQQPIAAETAFIRHVRLAQPLEARARGEVSRGAILKHGLANHEADSPRSA